MEVLVYGTTYSVGLALIAIGFSLTFGISGVANLAHGAFYVLAGYISVQLMQNLPIPYVFTVILAVALTAIIGGLIYRFGVLRLRGLMLSEVIATYGIGIVILELLRWFGLVGFGFKIPSFMKGTIEIGDVIVDYQRLFIVLVGLVLVGLLWLFTRHTRTGLAFRAMSQNERTALAFGIKPKLMATLSVGLGSALVAVAAITVAPLGLLTVDGGYDIIMIAFAVAIVGGLESTPGIIVAAFLLGFAQIAASRYIGTHWIMIVNLLAILIVLIVKPSGLFGKYKELEERV
jgi:branched-chain amino acid transport system permease protein